MIINANALFIPLADKSIHTIVTSPPYYGLRDYQVSGQLGLEPTPDEYIANLVAVFRECKRILRDDGTLWVNIGDSFAGSGCGTNDYRTEKSRSINKSDVMFSKRPPQQKELPGCKPKDLIGIPWMLAFALRADGWYLRSDIIWAKKKCMPESVKDRPTKSHEYIFLLSKSQKYYYDNEAVKEVATGYDGRKDTKYKGGNKDMAGGAHERWQYKNLQPDGQQPNTMHLKRLVGDEYMSPVRNKRDVWFVSTKPYKGAHYATFPPDLITPCILAGAPETCCAKCGAPYERVVERVSLGKRYSTGKSKEKNESGLVTGFSGYDDGSSSPVFKTLGFQPTCTCNAGTTSGIVFDPFVGSGTTVATAIQLGRRGVGLDLSFKYLNENAKARIDDVRLPLLEGAWK